VKEARLRGQEYLLDRRLFRSRSTGNIISPRWLQFSYPTRYFYDVLWGLDYLRRAGFPPDERLAEVVELVVKKQNSQGQWHLDHFHAGEVHFEMDAEVGQPSRWNTIRALRVLDWYAEKYQSAHP
jgi:hypothetical protein